MKLLTNRTEMYGTDKKLLTIRTEMYGTEMKLLTIRTEMYGISEEATHNPYRNTEHFVHYKTRYMKHENELHTVTSINLMLCYKSMVERSDTDTSEKNIYILL